VLKRRIAAALPMLLMAMCLIGVAAERAGASGLEVSVGDASVWEGDPPVFGSFAGVNARRTATVAVTLSEPATAPVTVEYSFVEGSATLNELDFFPLDAPRILSFKPGVVRRFVDVSVQADWRCCSGYEGDETFTVVLANPTGGAVIGDGAGTVTILDDDPPPKRQLSITDASVWEGHAGGPRAVKVWVTLADRAPALVTVVVTIASGSATSAVDFRSATRLVTIRPGHTKKSLIVFTYPDASSEPDETIEVTLAAATGAEISDQSGVITVLDDD
jgi:hypothetical protein